MTRRAFAIGAHPDDIEFLMAGTLLRLRDAGFEIHCINVANGSCGSVEHDAETTARTRRAESVAACELVGATYHESLCPDLEILYALPLLRRLAAVVRQVSPDVMLVHAPVDYMEDHVNAGRLAVTAAFGRGMRNFATEPAEAPVDREVVVYHAQPYGNRDPLGRAVEADLYVDVGEVLDDKAAMLACHRSQKEWLDRSQGLDSYIDTMREMTREVGRMSRRFEYAEGWRRHSHFGLCAPDADPLQRALGDASVARAGA